MVVNFLCTVVLVGGALFAVTDFQLNAQRSGDLSCNVRLINGTRSKSPSLTKLPEVTCRGAVGCRAGACLAGDPSCVYRCQSMSRVLTRRAATLKSNFVVDTGNVQFRQQCFQYCDPRTQVVEIVVPKSTAEPFQCRCSRIRGVYLRLFRARYLTVPAAGLNSEIYARVGNSLETQFLLQAPQPALFYALDSVSGGLNLGTLGREKFSAPLNETYKGFTCDWVKGGGGGDGDQSLPSWRPKLLRVNAADRALYQLQHNGLISLKNNTAGYTILIWSRQDEKDAKASPLVAALTKDKLAWAFGHQGGVDQLQMRFGPQNLAFTSEKKVFTQRSWNNFGVRAINSTAEFFLNDAPMNGDLGGPQKTKLTVADTDFGDSLFFGVGKAPLAHTGCLGHLMIFGKRLRELEIDAFNDLIQDDIF